MVFGLGKKQIEVILDKYGYAPGETITGKVTLNLKGPVEARQLRVALIGEATATTVGRGVRQRTSRVYDFRIPLDGERLYTGGEYSFEIKIPGNILQMTPGAPGGVVGEAVKAVQFLSGAYTRISWHVQATLDRPMKGDIDSKKIQVTIG